MLFADGTELIEARAFVLVANDVGIGRGFLIFKKMIEIYPNRPAARVVSDTAVFVVVAFEPHVLITWLFISCKNRHR